MVTHMRQQPIPEEDPRERRLPKWAQERMRELRQIAAHAQEVANDARLATGPERSHAVLDQWGDIPVGLGEWPEVTFRMPGQGRHISIQHDRERRAHAHLPGRLRIVGSDSLIIRPHVSNVITVELRG